MKQRRSHCQEVGTSLDLIGTDGAINFDSCANI